MKQYGIALIVLVAGIFGPIFAVAGENSTKDISSTLSQHSSVRATSPVQTGIASWYGPGFHGRPMANGKPYDMGALTVAHRTLRLGTTVRIRKLSNGRTVIVKVTDRGPYIPGRIVDLSKGAANKLGIDGLGRVAIEKI